MNKASGNQTDMAQKRGHWDAYWRSGPNGAGPDAQALTGAAQSAALTKGWADFFKAELPKYDSPRILDLACGVGVVAQAAHAVAADLGMRPALMAGADYSPTAALHLGATRGVGDRVITAFAADASAMPIAPGSFDLVVSQFGLEYAGAGAFGEAARIIAVGGVFEAVAHYKDGAIDRECQTNLQLIDLLVESGLVGAVRQVFVDPSSPLGEVERLLREVSAAIAGAPRVAATDLAARFCADVSRLIARRAAFEPAEILTWLEAMAGEISAYGERMRAMTGAALDGATVSDRLNFFKAAGFDLAEPEEVRFTAGHAPAAWRLTARRLA